MNRRWRYRLIGIVLVVLGWGWLATGWVGADECDNPSALTDVITIGQCVSRVREVYDAIAKANANNKETLSRLVSRVSGLQRSIGALGKNIENKEKLIDQQEEAYLGQYEKLAASARSYYVRSRANMGVAVLLGGGDVGRKMALLGLTSAMVRRDRETVTSITENIRLLSDAKSKLQEEKGKLEKIKVEVDERAKFYQGEVAKASAYEVSLSSKIASLTARQNEILAEKSGTFQTSVGEVPLADDPASRVDYNPGFSPAYAAFSFGAPHYRGLSQYGALGRARSGQSYEAILKAYYGNVRVESVDTNFSIKTSAGGMAFEDRYLLGIAEMPSRWGSEGGMEALKAQAIAARSYALAYTGWRMGSRSSKTTICVTEACQVWKTSKANNPGEWRSAVVETRGKIMVGNGSGEVVNAWYASTSGGYQESYASLGHATPGFWDTPRGRDGWTSEAYERKAESPWFYKGWYRDRSGRSCGKSHPWLTSKEMADIINAWVVRYKGSGDEVARVAPVDGDCWGGGAYSYAEMKERALKYGGGYEGVNGVTVSYGTNGVTASVKVSTDKGEVNIPGGEFKTAFNLRAPGRISIKSGLFNIEKK